MATFGRGTLLTLPNHLINSMKRIIIIGEGQTEQSFCNDVLQPHFLRHSIYVQNPVIKKTRGGIVNWQALKHQVEQHLKQDKSAFVTTLIDYYGIHAHHKYPRWENVKHIQDKSQVLSEIERSMQEDVNEEWRHRFIPYIQLHEFEGLLFSDIDVFTNSFEENELLDYEYLAETIENNPNPEMINDGNETAPSKRLAKIIKGYYSDNENMKVFYGAILAHDIGLFKIRNKCPRFNHWIETLETI